MIVDATWLFHPHLRLSVRICVDNELSMECRLDTEPGISMASTAPRLETAASREATNRAPSKEPTQIRNRKAKKKAETRRSKEQEAKNLASSYLPIRISKSQPEIEV
ncbi:hypothetical protein TRV_03817 [Trichophyton verrucosum HKI 0517]|uniref:Uncharacterized protein n=1 Tax=Trichophyton verrucosum (strain HKI 0517) TaxID=663202 RepID=D4D9M4_TRIVH|nr:uncharacterized protein TRV_03817 [Trichophyton verrucosum HKI 0517]EFE41458.1 hypothetical protein TRV_03817 [Trichophyton verrucosum HKI 0517]